MSVPEHQPLPSPDPGIDPRDAVRLLRLMGEVAVHRTDPRGWRLELLNQLINILPADVAVAIILKKNTCDPNPIVVGIFDVGFKHPEQRQNFLQEFNVASFQDPVSRALMTQLASAPISLATTLTALRSDVLDDDAWHASPHVQQFRDPAGLGDCIVSAQRRPVSSPDLGHTTMFLCAYRRAGEPSRFRPRHRLLLDSLHAGLSWMYQVEESSQRISRASALSPRLRQTLDFLLSGDTERQVALKMNISAHTVHDYVKALYIHFGVSSRSELLARWIQSGGEPPPQVKE